MAETTTPDLIEIGASGLEVYSGNIFEEWLPELQGYRWQKVVRQMSENDSTCAAVLLAIENLAKQTSWDVVAASDDAEDKENQEFFKQCLLEDMSHSWQETLSEILSELVWGWSLLEEVYKVRGGEVGDPSRKSRFNDGRIGWRKWAIRGQETLQHWEFDESGGVQAMFQSALPDFSDRRIPLTENGYSKALLFKTTSKKSNPEGRSILRAAYPDWYYKTNIGRIEAIGIERDLAGLPVIWLPVEYLSPSATPEQKAIVEMFKKIVTRTKRNEQEGVLMPLMYKEGNKVFDFTLMSTGGRRQFDTESIYQRYNVGIAISMLADFIFLGHQKVGSFALSVDKSDLFTTALTAFLDGIESVINRYAIPSLAKLNAIKSPNLPHLKHGDVDRIDMKALADLISSLSGAGFNLADVPDLLNHILRRAKLPVADQAA
jgi:hypothetical protein